MKTILNNKRTSGGITIPDLKLYLQSNSDKDSQVDQQNRSEDPEITPHTYGHLIFDKEAKNIQRKKKASSINGAGLTGNLYIGNNENRSVFVTFHKTQVQADQGPQHKTSYTESNRREIGKEP